MRTAKPLFAAVATTAALAAVLVASGRLTSASPGYTLHEWGTFTSVSGSDGVLLPGLEVEEETLPSFVYAHDGFASTAKGWERPIHNATIKMETPVIYFYSNQGFRAHVDVGFEGGSISQWYPDRSGGETPPAADTTDGAIEGGDIDFAETYRGAIRWDVDVLPPGDYPAWQTFKGDETTTWLLPRQTDANYVRTATGEQEKYLFYRGVGNLALPLRTSMPDDGTIRLENRGGARIPFLMVYHLKGDGRVSFLPVPALDAGGTVDVPVADLDSPRDWHGPVYDTMATALREAGLFRSEADAMVQTWWRSYFQSPGTRVFWIVPQEFTERVLPLTARPTPSERVRVLVGRSEVLTPAFEREIVTAFEAANKDDNPWQWDRYADAYAARVMALTGKRVAPTE